jgi:TetR/AcrR family transcriptional repressor of mexJK operon
VTSAAPTPAEFEGEHTSARKRRAIIEAATTVFLSNGYLGTTMDEIAARARVSRQTVYKHFADKERLFSEIVTANVVESANSNTDEVLKLGTRATSSGTCAVSPAVSCAR